MINARKGLLCLMTFSVIPTVYYVNFYRIVFDVHLQYFHSRNGGLFLFGQQEIQSLPTETFTCDSILTIGKVRVVI